jgi:hypothetical protein
MHAQSVNPLFPNVSLPVREKAVVGEPAKKSEYTGQPIAPAEVRIFLQCIQSIYSITFIQNVHPSPFAEVPLHRVRRRSDRMRRSSVFIISDKINFFCKLGHHLRFKVKFYPLDKGSIAATTARLTTQVPTRIEHTCTAPIFTFTFEGIMLVKL